MPLERFMQKLLASYAMYYNRRHGHRGYVFNSRYFSILVGDAWYEMVLQRYVIRNRFVAGLVRSLKDLIQDPWTSLGALLGAREVRYLSVEIALSVFGKTVAVARASLIKFLEIPTGEADPYLALLEAARKEKDPLIIGADEFVAEQRARFHEANPEPEAVPAPATLEVLIREVCVRRGVSEEDLSLGRRSQEITEARTEV
ncbi:MAG: transposase, partial [Thermoanaerobaculia bacterium]